MFSRKRRNNVFVDEGQTANIYGNGGALGPPPEC